VFFLSEAPSSPMTPYSPPPHTHVYTVYLFTQGRGGGRELTREKVRGAIVHKPGRKYQLYLQTINSIKPPVKTTFRVWCRYSYLVHGHRRWSIIYSQIFHNLHLTDYDRQLSIFGTPSKKLFDIPVPSRDVTYQTLPGREL
jgi:hypothetical protein